MDKQTIIADEARYMMQTYRRADVVLAPVSYTHLTLPTSDLAQISVVAVSLKKKNKTHKKKKKNIIKE